MRLPPEEPFAGPWRVESIDGVARRLVGWPPTSERTRVVAIDGRSSSGQSTLARRMADQLALTAVVVHTDDLAWHHSMFAWDDLAGPLIEAVRAGKEVGLRPPEWERRGREGAVEVAAGTTLLLLEGVGSSRRSMSHLLDASVWVQSDLDAILGRNEARMRAGEVSEATLEAWMAKEFAFIAEDRPWERAKLVVAGTPALPHDDRIEVVVADPPREER